MKFALDRLVGQSRARILVLLQTVSLDLAVSPWSLLLLTAKNQPIYTRATSLSLSLPRARESRREKQARESVS